MRGKGCYTLSPKWVPFHLLYRPRFRLYPAARYCCPCSTFPPVQISVVSFVSRVLTLVFSSLFFVRSSFLFYSLRFKKRKDTFYNFSILSLFIVSKNMLLRIYRSTVLFSSSLIRNGRNKLLLSSNFRSAQREAIFLPPSPRGKHRDFGLSTEWSSLFFLFFPVSYDSNRIDLNKVANRDVKLYAGRFTNRFLESCTASLPLQ